MGSDADDDTLIPLSSNETRRLSNGVIRTVRAGIDHLLQIVAPVGPRPAGATIRERPDSGWR
jgi:hypothetical protein